MTRKLIFLLLAWVISTQVFAAPGAHNNEGEAFSHCSAASPFVGDVNEFSLAITCGVQCLVITNGCRKQSWAVNNGQLCSNGTAPSGNWPASHGEFTYALDCSQIPGIDASTDPIVTDICVGGCQLQKSTGVGVCIGNTCFGPWAPTGGVCDFSNDVAAPDGCSVTGAGTVACDCVANPTAPFCPGGSNPPPAANCITAGGITTCTTGSSGGGGTEPPPPASDPGTAPGDNTSTGGNEGGGDGNVDTPGVNDGTGAGDATGDGTRNIDCNPLSNPDCEFRGSGTARGDCSAEPACTGDPVQCALLQQSWRVMCFPFNDQGSALSTWTPTTGNEFDSFNQTVDLSIGGGLDDTGFLAAGTCPAAESVTLIGSAFVIDYQPFCDAATWLSFLVMFMASIVAARILFT